jgi:hypothetical protein
MNLRKISELLEPYPQLLDPLKAYKWRHSYGEKIRRKSTKNCYFDCGSFEQGLDEEVLERLLQHHLKIVSFLLNFASNIIGLFPSRMWFHVLVYVQFDFHRWIFFS